MNHLSIKQRVTLYNHRMRLQRIKACPQQDVLEQLEQERIALLALGVVVKDDGRLWSQGNKNSGKEQRDIKVTEAKRLLARYHGDIDAIAADLQKFKEQLNA